METHDLLTWIQVENHRIGRKEIDNPKSKKHFKKCYWALKVYHKHGFISGRSEISISGNVKHLGIHFHQSKLNIIKQRPMKLQGKLGNKMDILRQKSWKHFLFFQGRHTYRGKGFYIF